MRATFLAAAFLATLTLAAQVSVAYIEKIYSADSKNVRVAGFAHDASFVLLTDDNYTGIEKLDINSKLLTNISNKKDAGYNCVIENDDSSVIFKETYEAANGDTYHAYIEYDFLKHERHLAYMPYISAAKSDNGNQIISIINLRRTKLEKKPIPSMATTDNLQLLLTNGINTKVLSPNGQDQSYIWVSLSPDKNKVCYYVAAHGCYICDTQGDNIQFISRDYIDAKWLNNNILTATEIKTDDSQSRISRIVAFTTNGTKTPLTKYYNGAIRQYSSVGTKQIVFSDNNGGIYLIHLNKINK